MPNLYLLRRKRKAYLPNILFIALLLVVAVVLFSYFEYHEVHAATTSLTTRLDFEAGDYFGTTSDEKRGDLNLSPAGSWGPRVFESPDVALTVGTGLVSDGTYVYVLEGRGTYFARYNTTDNSWKVLADAPHSTDYGADLLYLNGYIYAIFGGYQKEFSRYDIGNNTWTEMAQLPDLVYRGSSLATDGTTIFATRGINTTDFWKYDVSGDSWTVAPSTPATLYYGSSLEYYNGYLYAPRGNNQYTLYRYDISGETWSTMSNAPFRFNGDGTCDIKGAYMYCLRNSNVTDFARYDISGDSWDTLADTPQTARYVGIVYNSDDDQLYVFRGNDSYDFWKYDEALDEFEGPENLLNTPGSGADLVYYGGYLYQPRGNNNTAFYRYNISSDSWESRASAPASFNDDTKGVVAGSYLYFFRGSNTSSFYRYDPTGNSWSTMSDTPSTVRYGGTLAYPGSGDYIYGTRGNFQLSFWRYSITGDSWDDGAVADIPDNGEASYGARLVTDGTDLYYISGSLTSKIFFYDISEDTWTEIESLKFAPYWGTDVAYYNGKLYMTAGYYKDDFWEYTISGGTWRRLDSISSTNRYDAGSYNGGSLETDGSGNFYFIRGQNSYGMELYTVDSDNYPTSGTWVSDIQDLTYVTSWTSLTSSTTTPSDSAVSFETRSSTDLITWSSWEAVSGTTIASPARRYMQVRATLTASTDKTVAPTLHSISINYSGDTSAPTNPDTFTGTSQEVGGSSITSGQTYSHAQPHFSWSGATDSETSVTGYYVYFGTSSSADPETAGNWQTASTYTSTAPLTTGTYYLRVKTKDTAGNVSSATTGFTYVYAGVAVQSLTLTTTDDFDDGTLTNVSAASDEIKLSSKAGFWLEERLSAAPASIRMGADMSYISSSGKIYALRGNNNTAFYEYDISTDTWSTLASTPASVYYGGALVQGPSGYLYAFRGYNTTSFWRYDIAGDTWSDEDATDAPQAIYYGGALEYDGSQYIYAFRGNNDDSFLRYDTLADEWQSLTSADFGDPTIQVNNLVRGGGGLTFDGSDTIYAIQGDTRSGFASYSIENDEWSQLTNVPSQAYYGARIEYDSSSNSVFYFPGWDKPYFYKYDISESAWSQLSDAPAEFYYGASMISTGGTLYILRGDNSTTFYKYDTSTDSWFVPTVGLFGTTTYGTDVRTISYGSAIVKGDGDYYYLARGNYDNLFVRYDGVTGEIVTLEDIPIGQYQGGYLVYESTNDKIYATGSVYDDSFYIYDIDTDTWSELTQDPVPADPNYGTSMIYDGSRYIYWTRGQNSTTFYRYDTQASAGSRWEALSNSPAGLGYGSKLVSKGGYIYVMRGQNVNNNPLYRYDPDLDTWSSSLTVLPGYIYNDGFLVDGGGDYLYACRGGNTSDCWRYSITGDSWETIADAPANIYYGGHAAADGSSKMMVIAGPGSNTYNNGLYTYIMQTDSTSFEESGTYSSATHDLTSVYRWANLTLDYTSASNTTLTVSTRSSSNGTDWDDWTTASKEKSIGTTYTYKINSSTNRYLQVKFAMTSTDGIYSGTIGSYSINYYQDTDSPTNPSSVSGYSDSGLGTSITTGSWYGHAAPHFDWPDAEAVNGASDTATGSGVLGYYVYFGTNAAADPSTDGVATTDSEYTASSLTSGQTYYLRIETYDDAGNVSAAVWAPFTYKYDSSAPDVPSNLSADPSGYSATDSFDFSWTAPSDVGSGIDEYCYKTGASSGDYATDQCTSSTSISAVPSYQSGTNIFYVRAKDVAGNYSSYATVSYYYSGSAPTPPQNLTATPTTNTANSFAFDWDAPETYFGAEENLVYRYSINALPTSSSTTETTATSLDAAAFATLPGENTFYIVAEDEAGNVDYGVYATTTFTANTSAPGIPTEIDIADVSVKATESWKIAVSWEAPADEGSGVSSYKIFRSADGSSFTEVASTGGISYVDTGLTQQTYYYKVKACDSANNCGALTGSVEQYPDGKFTEPAPLVADPVVSAITTQKATITWTTSRTADSKVAFGTSSEDYNDEEVSSSEQVTSHSILLGNLDPGTKYYFVAKWTDEDGNTGISDEVEFTTDPAPSASEITATDISLTTTSIVFTSKDASKAKIYYGKSTAFGGLKEISVSATETTYTVPLEGLEDGVKYFYKVNLFDVEEEEYEGDTYSFETLPRPRISDVVISQLQGLAEPTVFVTWSTNTPVSSIVDYYPLSNPGELKNVVSVELEEGRHRTVIPGLKPQTDYNIRVSGLDVAGNEASSDNLIFSTSADSRAPLVSNLKIEGSINRNGGDISTAQLVVSWTTDEPATSQVEYGEGSGSTYAQKTQEDSNLANNHLVVISNLVPSKVYHLRVLSKDVVGNEGTSVDNVTITPKATDNALDLVIDNLSEVFGFLDQAR